MKRDFKKNGGYAILETVFYIVLFALLSLSVIDAMITMSKSFKETTIQSELMQGGSILSKISREIRQAYSINSINTNSLKLNTTEGGVSKTVEFNLLNSNIRFLENDTFIDNLNSQNITVSNLLFTQINTTEGVAVKVHLVIRSKHDNLNRDQDFYTTVVLRGDY